VQKACVAADRTKKSATFVEHCTNTPGTGGAGACGTKLTCVYKNWLVHRSELISRKNIKRKYDSNVSQWSKDTFSELKKIITNIQTQKSETPTWQYMQKTLSMM